MRTQLRGRRTDWTGTTGGRPGFFKGRIDKVRIHDLALVAGAILDLYEKEFQ